MYFTGLYCTVAYSAVLYFTVQQSTVIYVHMCARALSLISHYFHHSDHIWRDLCVCVCCASVLRAQFSFFLMKIQMSFWSSHVVKSGFMCYDWHFTPRCPFDRYWDQLHQGWMMRFRGLSLCGNRWLLPPAGGAEKRHLSRSGFISPVFISVTFWHFSKSYWFKHSLCSKRNFDIRLIVWLVGNRCVCRSNMSKSWSNYTWRTCTFVRNCSIMHLLKE